MRVCTFCKEEKPLDQFPPHGSKAKRCRPCHAQRMREWRHSQPPKPPKPRKPATFAIGTLWPTFTTGERCWCCRRQATRGMLCWKCAGSRTTLPPSRGSLRLLKGAVGTETQHAEQQAVQVTQG